VRAQEKNFMGNHADITPGFLTSNVNCSKTGSWMYFGSNAGERILFSITQCIYGIKPLNPVIQGFPLMRQKTLILRK
jgi:hypothetical protein